MLSGGCVQEEIRFAICPELVIGALLCPVMGKREAIQIVGAEQYSRYSGYMFKLRYDGDFVDKSERAPDGTPLNGIAAIDALDGRYIRPFSLAVQLQTDNMLRELNKAAAGFAPPTGLFSLPPHPPRACCALSVLCACVRVGVCLWVHARARCMNVVFECGGQFRVNCVSAHTRARSLAHTHTHVHVYTRTHAHTHAHTTHNWMLPRGFCLISTRPTHTHTHTHAHTHTYTHTYTHLHTHTHTV